MNPLVDDIKFMIIVVGSYRRFWYYSLKLREREIDNGSRRMKNFTGNLYLFENHFQTQLPFRYLFVGRLCIQMNDNYHHRNTIMLMFIDGDDNHRFFSTK